MAPSSVLRQKSLFSFFSKPALPPGEQQAPASSIQQHQKPDLSDSLTHESSCSLDQDGDSLTWSQLLAESSWSEAALRRDGSAAGEASVSAVLVCEGSQEFANEGIRKRRRTPRGLPLRSEKKMLPPSTNLSKECLDSELGGSAVGPNLDLDQCGGEDLSEVPVVTDGEIRGGAEEAQALPTLTASDLEPAIPDLRSSEVGSPSSSATKYSTDGTKLESPRGVADDDEALADSLKPLNLKRGGTCRRVSASEEPVGPPITDYERQREETIRRNNSFLLKLGISSTVANIKTSRQAKPKGKAVWKSTTAPILPLRRSTRRCPNAGGIQADTEVTTAPILSLRRRTRRCPNAGKIQPEGDTEMKESTLPECIEDDAFSFDDSSVLKYTCGDRLGSGVIQAYDNLNSDENTIVRFQPLQRQLRDPYLTWIYAMNAGFVAQTQRVLLAAGGPRGQIAVFGVDVDGDSQDDKLAGSSLDESEVSEEETGPLLSWKGSSGWISGVKFLSAQNQENAMLLLSSSNDGNLVLWDINKQQKMQQSGSQMARSPPLMVTEAPSIHSDGIFSMDEFGCQVATASKDSTVVLSKITAPDIHVERWISGHHSGVIRGVNFRDASTLADCGADGLICVLDMRTPDPCSIVIETADATVLNMVEWCPSNVNLLLSASRDPQLSLHDIRIPKEPLYRLSGHLDAKLHRCPHIYRPAFVAQGQAVATPGQGSKSLSLYSVATGCAISRGFLGYDASMVMWTAGGGNVSSVLWMAAKHISQLIPSRR